MIFEYIFTADRTWGIIFWATLVKAFNDKKTSVVLK
jgi:hypothetical protein